MNEENKNNSAENKPVPEIPENSPPTEIKPVKNMAGNTQTKFSRTKKLSGTKIAYALVILIAFGGAMCAKLYTEKSLGALDVPIESEYTTAKQNREITFSDNETSEFQVRQNVTDVPDTRTETKPVTEITVKETTVETTAATKYAVPYKDYYTLPLGTDILRDYSPKTPSYNSTMGDWRTHGAIDFKGADGSQIKAISNGKVIDISDDPLFGTVITIDHGNEVVAKYCGFNKDVVEVSKGDFVKNGQLLGYLGEIPCEKSDISHLHFEIYYKGENVDPLSLMNK